MYNTVFFDLDGTLTDPAEGITNSVAFALSRFGIEVEDKTTLYKFIGPPLMDAFQEFYGFSHKDSALALGYYREYFKVKGIYENKIYDGVKQMLTELKTAGKKIVLATSKPEPFAITILEHFCIKGYFDFIAGATMDEKRNKKSDVLAYAIKMGGVVNLSEAVMIGDREHDIFGAKENGIDSVGVLYGYGDREELQKAGATYIAESIADINKIIL